MAFLYMDSKELTSAYMSPSKLPSMALNPYDNLTDTAKEREEGYASPYFK